MRRDQRRVARAVERGRASGVTAECHGGSEVRAASDRTRPRHRPAEPRAHRSCCAWPCERASACRTSAGQCGPLSDVHRRPETLRGCGRGARRARRTEGDVRDDVEGWRFDGTRRRRRRRRRRSSSSVFDMVGRSWWAVVLRNGVRMPGSSTARAGQLAVLCVLHRSHEARSASASVGFQGVDGGDQDARADRRARWHPRVSANPSLGALAADQGRARRGRPRSCATAICYEDTQAAFTKISSSSTSRTST